MDDWLRARPRISAVCLFLILGGQTSFGSQVEALLRHLAETLPHEQDQRLILKVLGCLSETPAEGGLRISGPTDRVFYFADWKTLSRTLTELKPDKDFDSNPSLPLQALLNPAGKHLHMQPARLKEISFPCFSPISGHRIASLKISSISPLYQSFGPFRIPVRGYALENAELILSSP
jgi:hypothetical protein